MFSRFPKALAYHAIRYSFYIRTACLILALLATAAAQPRTFHRVLLLEPKGETSAGIGLGDIDKDGDLDVILAKGRHWPLQDVILRNDGKGRFASETFSEAADRTYSAAVADLDGDGDLDIAVSNDKPDKKLIYKNDGKGRFQLSGAFGDPNWTTRYITLADVNGDRRPDILVANRSDPKNPRPSYVCLNDGRGAFPNCTPLPTQSATIIVAADFDGDGFTDLLVPHRDGGQSLIFWNDGKANFAPAAAFGPVRSNIRAAAAGDLDGDGKPDIVIGDEATGVFIFLNNGSRRFGAPMPLGKKESPPYSVALADMDKDGRVDVVIGNLGGTGSVFFNQLMDRKIEFQQVNWGDGKGDVYGVAIGDLDGDGWPDIAAARSDAPNVIWFNGKE